jgi:hypothetical protein
MSIVLRSGKVAELTFLFMAMALVLYYLWSALKGKPQPLRRLPAVDAISDGIDRAVEEGKPVYVGAGDLAYLSGMYAPMTINGMNILRYTARMCVQKGAKIIIPSPYNPEALPLIDGIYREVCVSEGKPEAYNRENVRYYGNREMSWYMGAIQDVLSTGCSLLVLVGALSSAGIYMAGAALDDGALVIAGTPRYAHQASWAAMADYPLFCEDIYGAGALCSGDPVVASSQVGGDLVKLIMIGVAIVFAILAVAGLPVATKGGWLFQ